MRPTLYLASQSPRRAALIKLIGVSNVVIYPSQLEEEILPELGPGENAARLAVDKARWVKNEMLDTGVIVGADTIVVLDGHILGKPKDPADAIRMLLSLSGRTHTVFTGVGLVDTHADREESFFISTEVTFRELEQDEIRRYVATGAPLDKAGSYGIQEDFGAVFVTRIDGDYYNVVGLPLCELYLRLKRFAPDLMQ